ncbi:MAG: alpha/beta hydrolase, partial [Pseudolabrys sp.]
WVAAPAVGSGVAVALAAQRKLAGVILVTPYDSLMAVAQRHYPWLPVRWLIKDAWRSDQRIAKVKAPILVRHGTGDRVVPIRFGERLFKLAPEPKRFLRVSGAGHVDLDEDGTVGAVRQFLAALAG